MLRGSMLAGILGLALLVGTSESQEKKPKAKGQLPAGFKDLNLTAAQVEKVYEVQSQYKTQIDELKKKIKMLTADRTKAEFAVLTEEQKQLYFKNKTGEEAKKKEEKKKEEKKTDGK
jgi:sulfite reductase beta subunit-like hemoprotein